MHRFLVSPEEGGIFWGAGVIGGLCIFFVSEIIFVCHHHDFIFVE